METDNDRLRFPKQLMIRLVDERSGSPVRNIAVSLRLFAPRKNDYNLGPPLSDGGGSIIITEEWVRRGIDDYRNAFIMDYSATLEECKSHVLIKVMSNEEISTVINAMRLYKIENGAATNAFTISELMAANNGRYEPQEILVDLHVPGISEKEVQIRLRHLK